MNEYSLFAVIPLEYEMHTCIVPAKSKELAKAKAVEKNKELQALVKGGCTLKCVNLTDQLLLQGYNLEVSRVDMYH